MRVSLLLLPLVALGLAGCIDVHSHPTPQDTTVVAPAPMPAPTYAAPGYSTSTTVVSHP
jgi:hypothetical protein